MPRPLLIQGMKGLGDNIFQRPFVRAACETGRQVFLETPWPQLYADLPVKPVMTNTTLRTQRVNELSQGCDTWWARPDRAEVVRVQYGHEALRRGTIVQAMEKVLPLGRTPFAFDLPELGPAVRGPALTGKPLAVVRPVTVRREWRNEARNPRPEYLRDLAKWLRPTHRVVVVAHLAAGEEWLEGELPDHDEAFVHGQLDMLELLRLVRDADLVVGGVGWLVPAAIALKTRAFIVLGGQGGHNAPEKITDPRMELSRIGWARPRSYCRCDRMLHRCNKLIPDLAAQWAAFLARQEALAA